MSGYYEVLDAAGRWWRNTTSHGEAVVIAARLGGTYSWARQQSERQDKMSNDPNGEFKRAPKRRDSRGRAASMGSPIPWEVALQVTSLERPGLRHQLNFTVSADNQQDAVAEASRLATLRGHTVREVVAAVRKYKTFGGRGTRGSPKKGTPRFNVVKLSTFLPGKEKVIAENLSWPKAWRLASKLNNEASEAFKTGRIMYDDVPEFQTREITRRTSHHCRVEKPSLPRSLARGGSPYAGVPGRLAPGTCRGCRALGFGGEIKGKARWMQSKRSSITG